MDSSPSNSPIDRILDRRLSGLTGEHRALARQRLGELADLLIRIAIRQVREAQEADSRLNHPGSRMDSSLPPI